MTGDSTSEPIRAPFTYTSCQPPTATSNVAVSGFAASVKVFAKYGAHFITSRVSPEIHRAGPATASAAANSRTPMIFTLFIMSFLLCPPCAGETVKQAEADNAADG